MSAQEIIRDDWKGVCWVCHQTLSDPTEAGYARHIISDCQAGTCFCGASNETFSTTESVVRHFDNGGFCGHWMDFLMGVLKNGK